jgi:hypothetical protein
VCVSHYPPLSPALFAPLAPVPFSTLSLPPSCKELLVLYIHMTNAHTAYVYLSSASQTMNVVHQSQPFTALDCESVVICLLIVCAHVHQTVNTGGEKDSISIQMRLIT